MAKVQQKCNTAKSDVNKLNVFQTSNGEIWGIYHKWQDYIDPSVVNADTPIHEYTHIWAEVLRENNPKEWNNIVGLMDGTTLCNQVKRDYPELMTESDVADDVLATFIRHEPSTIPICADRANALLGNSQTLP